MAKAEPKVQERYQALKQRYKALEDDTLGLADQCSRQGKRMVGIQQVSSAVTSARVGVLIGGRIVL